MRLKSAILALALAASAWFAAPAQADTGAARYAIMNSTSALVIKNGPGVLLGVISNGVQTNVLSCYDNTAASGTLIYTATLSVLGQTQLFTPGVQYTTGLTCIVPTSIVGTILVMYI